MGFWDTVTDLLEAATPWAVAEAEAPVAKESTEETTAESTKEETETAETAADETPAEEETEEESEDGEAEEEEEEEDEEELVDPKETLEEECRNSKQCAPAKHHFDECVERVTGAAEGAAKEDCVEEFFHLAHCATACAAPKLWSVLK
ncbi:ubiquinol-cytochrome C reductase hinge protein-domain-containing protein [Cladorrhinum samala]|uniref:Cytochrome b-c1 complex subunit 6, mitochondrial n=1 Tax=Cladorrhinum samala TaxID=585594 RepID=A0AAV9HC57_9PEZI|nr:ubiquinol-cytochrome C reductase hinge protein-domain-containing protein [Cladorrhinum samala]